MPLQETLKHLKTGLAQSAGSGSWCAQVLVEPINHLWLVWALTLNVISPRYHLGASPLPLGVWYVFLLGSNILLLMVV